MGEDGKGKVERFNPLRWDEALIRKMLNNPKGRRGQQVYEVKHSDVAARSNLVALLPGAAAPTRLGQ